jgi:[protein-PII] uridylyltransferase
LTKTERFVAVRNALIADDGMTPTQRRRSLSDLTDTWLAGLHAAGVGDRDDGTALVAVGGYGRRELLPGSDLDLIVVHRDDVDAAALAENVFYPIWDAGLALDHSVRTIAAARELAGSDLKVALGLIDARHVAGDNGLTEQLRDAVRTDWRQQAWVRLPELDQMRRDRTERVGELAHLLEPDLVQAYGGLRDTTILRAIAASWVADQPHSAAISAAREWLLVVRDALHRSGGRPRDQLVFQDQDEVATRVGLLDPDTLLRKIAEAGRAIAYASDLTWREVNRTIAARQRPRSAAPRRRPLTAGVVHHEGEALLAKNVRPDRDAVLPLRAAAAAANAGLVLSPQTVERLARECPDLAAPWPNTARDALVSLLGAGRGLPPVWDAFDAAGLVSRWLPEWDRVRYRPTRTPVHRHTVDRHLIETAIVAAGLTRMVARPDLLLLAALFHDLGKGLPGDHSETGEKIAGEIGLRIGLPAGDAATLALLVRQHLLLPEMATRRDLDDPATVDAVVQAVGTSENLDLLAALTEADATAAGPVAWSPQRARLVGDLVGRVRAVLGGDAPPKPPRLQTWQEELATEATPAVRLGDVSEDRLMDVTIVAPDAPNLLAHVAGLLALRRLDVRRAVVETVADRAVLVWTVSLDFGDPPAEAVIREDLVRVLDGRTDVAARLAERAAGRSGRMIRHAEPNVRVLSDASHVAAVVEVRAHDEPALLYRLASSIADNGATIRSAAVETLGSEAVDVFYLVDGDGAPLAGGDLGKVTAGLASALGLSR